MIGRPRFPFRLFQGPPPSPAQRLTIAPVPAVEPGSGVGGRPPTPIPDDCHGGSANLEEWPPSGAERQAAADTLALPDGTMRFDLMVMCQSEARALAVLHRIRIERAAEAVVARVTGGTR